MATPLSQIRRKISLLIFFSAGCSFLSATSYYVDSVGGNDGNAGTSSGAPWQTLNNVNAIGTFSPGDQILLKRGSTWTQGLVLAGDGTSAQPITLGAYGTGAKPKIQRTGSAGETVIELNDVSHWIVDNLEIANANAGLSATYSAVANEAGLTFTNLYVHDINVGVYSAGIYIGHGPSLAPSLPTAGNWVCKDIKIENCQIDYTGGAVLFYWGMSVGSQIAESERSFQNVLISNCDVFHTRGATGIRGITDGRVVSNRFEMLAQETMPQGTTGLFTWHVDNLSFINNSISKVPWFSVSDNSGIDLEGYVTNTKIFGNYIQDTAGAAITFLQIDATGILYRTTAGDNITNVEVVGNSFIQNGVAQKSYGSLLESHKSSNLDAVTGTITDNFYYAPVITVKSPYTPSYSTGLLDGAKNTSYNFVNFSPKTNNREAGPLKIHAFSESFGSSQNRFWHWSPEIYNGSAYSAITTFDAALQRWTSSDGNVYRAALLPAATSTKRAAMAWVAPLGGTIDIRGRVAKIDITGGDGVRARITKNAVVVWPVSGIPQAINFNDGVGFNTTLNALAVSAGDVIRFEIDSGASSNNANDLTSWAPVIAYANAVGGQIVYDGSFEIDGGFGWSPITCNQATINSYVAPADVRSGFRSFRVYNRTAVTSTTQSDLKDALTASGQGTYDLSAWLKFASGADDVRIILDIDDTVSAPRSIVSGPVNIGTTFTQIATTMNLTWGGTLVYARLRFQSASSLGEYHVDDVQVARSYASNLVANPGFESGSTSWTAQTCSIAANSSNPKSGTNGCEVTSRAQVWGSPVQNITTNVRSAGQGTYDFSAWLKLSAGSDKAVVVVRIVDSAGTHWIPSSYFTIGTTYTQAAAHLPITWTGTLTSAIVYIQTQSSLANLSVDDFYLGRSYNY